MMIHDSFELALNITAFIPCLLLIILYLIDFKNLKFQNYFKLELMISLLLNISLNFVKNYGYIKEEDIENKDIKKDFEALECDNTQLEIIGLIKSYLEIVNILFLASFNYLCYIILKNKNKEDKKGIIITLSIINWFLPSYEFILYFLSMKDNQNTKYISISGKCIYNLEIKQDINLYLVPFIFIIDIFFYVMILITLNMQKKKDENHIDIYTNQIKRITFNFISHFIFFVSQYINITILYFEQFDEYRYLYININYNISLTILCIFCLIENKTREYYKKLIEWLNFEKIKNNENEDEDDEDNNNDDDYDEDDDMIVYLEGKDTIRNTNENNNNNNNNV